jgi:hypothetical protein
VGRWIDEVNDNWAIGAHETGKAVVVEGIADGSLCPRVW